VERAARLPVLSAPTPKVVVRLVVLVAGLAAAPRATAAVFMTQGQALELAFPGARIERMPFVLTEAEVKAVQTRARVKVSSRLATAYCAWRGDTLAGTAFFDTRIVRSMPGVFMVVVAPDTTIARVDVVAFDEPPDYRPPSRWLGLLAHRRLNDRLWPRRDIRNLAGATLSTRAVTESVRLSLAQYEIVVAPKLQRRSGPQR
jgi:hypothetical protein